jgi:predicted nucleic acid-binding protein
MRFWDSSAIVPLLVDEPASQGTLDAYVHDPDVVVWWATEVECISALARLERDGMLEVSALGDAIDRLDQISLGWHEIQPASRTRQGAIRLLRVHALRAGDAFQLAAAITAAEGEPGSLPFVTLDGRLAEAASREGFRVVTPTADC